MQSEAMIANSYSIGDRKHVRRPSLIHNRTLAIMLGELEKARGPQRPLDLLWRLEPLQSKRVERLRHTRRHAIAIGHRPGRHKSFLRIM